MNKYSIKVSVKCELRDFQSYVKLCFETGYVILNEIYGLGLLLCIAVEVVERQYVAFCILMLCWLGNEIWFRVVSPKQLFKNKVDCILNVEEAIA